LENFTHHIDIDELLAKYLAGEASSSEQAQVEDWLEQDEANRHYFEHCRMIWTESVELAPVAMPDENKAWENFQHRVGQQQRRSSNNWWKVAASIVLVAAAGMLGYMVFTNKEQPVVPVTIAFATQNEVKADTLPDGSVATLNKNSAISYSSVFEGKTRQVRLKGEAFFAVTPDKTKPFIIDVNDVTVRVVGTSFNVKSTDSTTEVIVETGIVQVTKNGQMVELKAGERIAVSTNQVVGTKTASGDKLYNYYRSRTFICDNTPLWKLVEKLNEVYDVNIVIGRKELRGERLNVTFDDESLDRILEVIKETFLVKIAKGENEILIH